MAKTADTAPAEERTAAEGSAVDQTVVRIRELIRTRGLGVGDVLPAETELAAMFGASRNTVREAIRMLRAFGVLESRQKVGAVITDNRRAAVMNVFSFAIDLSADTFRDVQGFRRLVEVNLFDALVGRLTPEAVARLEGSIERMAAAEGPAEATAADYDFHAELVGLAGNRTLAEIYGILRPVMLTVMETGKALRRARDSTVAEHRGILEALTSGDRISYAYRVSRHLDAGLEYIAPAAPERGAAAPRRRGSSRRKPT
ncbi:FadR/GntR family transcriptional regulator [Oharaeibacter diazotrophicus]|uniref:GntR family transcriptional regulator n=2 Tax=Oharaeibacter diazotrophicus TaxID=1920512 RepID=A0A4R6R8I8_9HYPH|nr:FCD domain-containing protein [Oharaeibacter diazotrophicus]TDP81896.1 GntR family transcriptional regulator [Oharaeibacter diazotrophicus]BBE73528.1 putative L-lactate dehydrogenase operon regulatory protein [Pleomorphomonas sp. SM30]GLS75318.1 GntR family transcriptional regulator [Oharaeibacter diazotrophicus]